MVDSLSFALVPADITGLFRRLNGAPMYDILDTLDALLKQKNFYPNPGVYRAQLDSAGIFVGRMELAMNAVMAKNGKQTTYDQLVALYSPVFAQLPEDQRKNIATYMTGGIGATFGGNKLVDQYLIWAREAMNRTRMLLHRGALNRGSDFFSGSAYATIRARNAEDNRHAITPQQIADIAIEFAGGNCWEFSATAYVQLQKMGARPVHWVQLVTGDHAFVLIGDGPVQRLDGEDLKRWGNSVVVCDAWDKAYYVASEIPKRLPSYKSPFNAQIMYMIPL